jgi:hypothetical protein
MGNQESIVNDKYELKKKIVKDNIINLSKQSADKENTEKNIKYKNNIEKYNNEKKLKYKNNVEIYNMNTEKNINNNNSLNSNIKNNIKSNTKILNNKYYIK